jgi:hypothetical protein
MEMQRNEREASLLDALRRLPPDTATELSALGERLAELAPNRRIDWSDSWSDEDLNEFRAASLQRLDSEESEGLRPGDVVVGVLVGAQETKVGPAVVIAVRIPTEANEGRTENG